MKTKLTKSTNAIRQTKTDALNKLNNLKSTAAARITKVKPLSAVRQSKTTIAKMFSAAGKYLIKILYLDKLDKKTLWFVMSTLSITFRFIVYTHLIVALLIYLSQLLDIEHKFTWDLYIYLFYIVYYFLRDSILDISNRIYSTIRSIMERLISNLHNVKETVDHQNNVTQPAKKAYRSFVDSGKIEDIQPKHDTNYYFYVKIFIAVAGTILVLGGLYYIFNHTEDATKLILAILTPIYNVTKKIVSAPKTVVKKIWNFFTKGKGKKRGDNGGLGGLPPPANTRPRDYPTLWEIIKRRIVKGEKGMIAALIPTDEEALELARANRMERGLPVASGSGSGTGFGERIVTELKRRGLRRTQSNSRY
uniref:hypothetical protein n=1 Tax=Porodaedalea mongolica TaxID=2651638 RepID=UPI0021ACCDE5|nr:hypothetical protein NYK79_mgp22 [Porodaedalea mongolica]UUA03968.1 hypothetical protein [Porodaedalea mongolica]WCF76735.1 hypothetical protein [Porodaedalea mongolica]